MNEAPRLPDTTGWRRIQSGETIPAGTPIVQVNRIGAITFNPSAERDMMPHAATWAPLPEPTPEPWTLIPEGRENAALLRVNGVAVGPAWRAGRMVLVPSLQADDHPQILTYTNRVTSVEPVQVVPEGARVLGDDEVAVPREMVERAKILFAEWEACVLDAPAGKFLDLARDLAAVEGGGER